MHNAWSSPRRFVTVTLAPLVEGGEEEVEMQLQKKQKIDHDVNLDKVLDYVRLRRTTARVAGELALLPAARAQATNFDIRDAEVKRTAVHVFATLMRSKLMQVPASGAVRICTNRMLLRECCTSTRIAPRRWRWQQTSRTWGRGALRNGLPTGLRTVTQASPCHVAAEPTLGRSLTAR